MSNVHEQSKEGYVKGDMYDKLRPRYPPVVLSEVHKVAQLKERLNIVEIGCGSGLFTRAMLEQWSPSINALKCYEPNENMLKAFREAIHDPRVTAEEGTFSSTSVEDGWADLIVVATAFHWCQDLEDALKEFDRILKPHGVICLVWISEDHEKGWNKTIRDLAISMPASENRPVYEYLKWKEIFDMPIYKEHFQPPVDTSVRYTTVDSLDVMVQRVRTWSPIAVLSEEKKKEFIEQMKQIIMSAEDLVWIDKKEGTFELPYAVPIVIIKRR